MIQLTKIQELTIHKEGSLGIKTTQREEEQLAGDILSHLMAKGYIAEFKIKEDPK